MIATDDIQIEEVWNTNPQVRTIKDFLSSEECGHMISLATPHLTDSVVSDSKGGHVSNGRTSKTAWISHTEDEITAEIAKKVSNLVGIPIENAEKFQVVYYGETNEYKPHYDSWDHNGSEKTLRCIKYGGPRMVTALMYLNCVEEGGSTKFTKLNIDITPDMGKLLLFNNTCEDSIDKHPLSEHAGMPVVKGKKYICNLWFRQYNKAKLYSEFNPEYYQDLKSLPTNDVEKSQKLEQLHKTKYICKHDEFLSSEECKQLIDSCTFSDSKYSSAWLKKSEFPSIILKIASLCNVSPSYLENMNVIKYQPGQKHGPFYDAYDVTAEKGRKYTEKLGQRVRTITICLGETIHYDFEKHSYKIIMNKGSILCYNNTENTNQCDKSMSHRVENVGEADGYLCNMYMREKDDNGNNNPLFQLTTLNQIQTSETSTSSKLSENYIDTYKSVLSSFKENKIARNWTGYKSFKYGFKGDFEYFKNCVVRYNELIEQGKGLNRRNLSKDYVFDEFTGVYVDNVVHDDMLELLKSYYRKTIDEKVFPLGDKQSNRFKAHNEPMSRFLHYEILPIIEKISSRKLMPTYTYLSSYTKNSDLPAHTDRDDCEFTVSFLVNKDVDWPIYLHKVKQPVKHKGRSGYNPDKDECIRLESDMGGFIMFSGTDHLHFRDKYEGEFYDILLLHYRGIDH